MTTFKVLTIDGGGIKGIYAASILNKFETDIRQKHGEDKRIVDYADLICGTSTGGLIALTLALRVPTETICDFYEKYGPIIFRGSQGLLALLKQTLFGGKFSDKSLRSSLEKIFNHSTLGDSHCLLCIPTYDFTNGTYGVFKFDHPEGKLTRHNQLSMVEIALATSAAPTYFPLAQIKLENNTQYVDGGVWANNPSLVGFAEAVSYFVGEDKPYNHLNLLSIASLNVGSGKAPILKRHRSFIEWAPDLFDLSLIGQSEFADWFLHIMQREKTFPLTYNRISSANIDSRQSRFIKLDCANEQAFSLMKQLATDAYHKYRTHPNIEKFFQIPKTYITQ